MSVQISDQQAQTPSVTGIYQKKRNVKNPKRLMDTLARYNLRVNEVLIVRSSLGARVFKSTEQSLFESTRLNFKAKKVEIHEIYIGEARI